MVSKHILICRTRWTVWINCLNFVNENRNVRYGWDTKPMVHFNHSQMWMHQFSATKPNHAYFSLLNSQLYNWKDICTLSIMKLRIWPCRSLHLLCINYREEIHVFIIFQINFDSLMLHKLTFLNEFCSYTQFFLIIYSKMLQVL